jgi:hypothetical protein
VLGGALLGALLLIPLTAHTPVSYLLAAYAVFGAGALASTGRQFGVSVGVAVTGSIVTSTGPQFVSASRAAWAVLGGCGILALLLGLLSTGRWAQRTAARNGQRLAAETQTQPRQADPLTPNKASTLSSEG